MLVKYFQALTLLVTVIFFTVGLGYNKGQGLNENILIYFISLLVIWSSYFILKKINNFTTPIAILVSGVLIAAVLFYKDDTPENKVKEEVAGQWHETSCKYYQGNDVNSQNKILNIRYKTGMGYEQRFYIGPFGLEDVTTRKGYAYGKKCAAEGSCNQRVAEYTFNEVSRTLNIEVRDYSDRYIYQYICGTK